jgi:hypothetical protein
MGEHSCEGYKQFQQIYFYLSDNKYYLWSSPTADYNGWHRFQIFYCPFCGAKLSDKQEEIKPTRLARQGN